MLTESVNSCLICGEDTSVKNSTRREISSRFITLISRFLGVDSHPQHNSGNNNNNGEFFCCCGNCFPLVDSFCDIYKNFESLKLELFHVLKKVSTMMTAFAKSTSTSASASNQFRMEIISKVESERLRCYPKVKLRRLKILPEPEPNHNKFANHSNNEFIKQKQKFDIPDVDAEPEILEDPLFINNDDDNDDNGLPDSLNLDYNHGHNDGQELLALSANATQDQCPGSLERNTEKDFLKYPEVLEATDIDIHNQDQDAKPSENKKGRKRKLRLKSNDLHLLDRTCLFCNKILRQPSVLIYHMRIHTQEKPFNCDICSKEFSENCLKSHKKVYHPDGRISASEGSKCNLCGKVVLCLEKHLKFVHGDSSVKKAVCHICGKGFVNRYTLRMHLESHSDVKSFSCDICPKTYKNKNNLNRHKLEAHAAGAWQNSHEENDINKCHICGKTFASKRIVKDHQKKVHGDPKESRKFKCPYSPCELAFYSNHHLTLHVRTHTGERPFQCDWDQCGAAFAQKHSLTMHMETHSGLRSFLCSICGQSFRQRSFLKQHEKNKHFLEKHDENETMEHQETPRE